MQQPPSARSQGFCVSLKRCFLLTIKQPLRVFQGAGDLIVVSDPSGNDMELIVPEGISAGATFLVYAAEDTAEEPKQDEAEAEAIRLEVEAAIVAAGEKEEQASDDQHDADETSARRSGGDKGDSGHQLTVESRNASEQHVSSDELAARARSAQTEAAAAAAEEAALRAEADEAAASAAKAARDERVALERVAALEAELQAAAEAEMSPGRLNPVHVEDDGGVHAGRERSEEDDEEEEALFSQGNSCTSEAVSNAGVRAVLTQGGLGLDIETGLAETGSPAGWGSPRRQVITHEDDWEAVILLNGHTYTADKRSGCVFHVPPEDENTGAERVEVGRWDPVQTLIVFNDAAAERERLRGFASARIAHGKDGHSDVATAMSDVSPRSIAAAVRRKQKQKEHSIEQQVVAASATEFVGGSEKSGAVSSRHAADDISSGNTSQRASRVASWAGPPQLILTEDEHDIIVEVLEEVYLVDLVRLSCVSSLCLLAEDAQIRPAGL